MTEFTVFNSELSAILEISLQVYYETKFSFRSEYNGGVNS